MKNIQELNGIIDSQRKEIDHTVASDEQSRRDQILLHEQLSEQNRDLREARIKSLHEMEDLKRVQGLRVVESSRRRLIENQDTINELTANDKPPDIWNTHGISGNVFANPPASSSSPHPGGFNPWISNVT